MCEKRASRVRERDGWMRWECIGRPATQSPAKRCLFHCLPNRNPFSAVRKGTFEDGASKAHGRPWHTITRARVTTRCIWRGPRHVYTLPTLFPAGIIGRPSCNLWLTMRRARTHAGTRNISLTRLLLCWWDGCDGHTCSDRSGLSAEVRRDVGLLWLGARRRRR
jgi:hypothetical protein